MCNVARLNQSKAMCYMYYYTSKVEYTHPLNIDFRLMVTDTGERKGKRSSVTICRPHHSQDYQPTDCTYSG
jgi:hypothetical protein